MDPPCLPGLYWVLGKLQVPTFAWQTLSPLSHLPILTLLIFLKLKNSAPWSLYGNSDFNWSGLPLEQNWAEDDFLHWPRYCFLNAGSSGNYFYHTDMQLFFFQCLVSVFDSDRLSDIRLGLPSQWLGPHAIFSSHHCTVRHLVVIPCDLIPSMVH